MSALRQRGALVSRNVGIVDTLRDHFLDALSDELWEWFDEHRDDRVLSVRKWFFSFTVHVRDLEGLFRVLLGPRDDA